VEPRPRRLAGPGRCSVGSRGVRRDAPARRPCRRGVGLLREPLPRAAGLFVCLALPSPGARVQKALPPRGPGSPCPLRRNAPRCCAGAGFSGRFSSTPVSPEIAVVLWQGARTSRPSSLFRQRLAALAGLFPRPRSCLLWPRDSRGLRGVRRSWSPASEQAPVRWLESTGKAGRAVCASSEKLDAAGGEEKKFLGNTACRAPEAQTHRRWIERLRPETCSGGEPRGGML